MTLKDQFLDHATKSVYCAEVIFLKEVKRNFDSPQSHQILLPIDYTESQWNEFLDVLDGFTYESEYDICSGTIWYHDGTWSLKSNNPNSNWEFRRYPTVPTYLYPD